MYAAVGPKHTATSKQNTVDEDIVATACRHERGWIAGNVNATTALDYRSSIGPFGRPFGASDNNHTTDGGTDLLSIAVCFNTV